MKKFQYTLLVAFTIGFVTKNVAQIGSVPIRNGFAIGGGITQFNIITDNLNIQKGDGWMGHMSATVDVPQKWFNVSYGMQLSESTVSLNGLSDATSSTVEAVDYQIFAVQVAFLWHAKPFRSSHFTIDFGPMLQYNSDLELDNNSQENYIIAELASTTAKDVEQLNNFNFNGTIGATLGLSHFKLKAQYIYGFTNILGALNDSNFNQTLNKQFKGNQSMLAFTAMITF